MFHSKIGRKILLIISLILLGATLLYLTQALRLMNNFGDQALQINEQGARKQTRTFLAALTHDQAIGYGERLRRIELASAMLGAQASQILAGEDTAPIPVGLRHSFVYEPDKHFYYRPGGAMIDLFWSTEPFTDQALARIELLTALGPLASTVVHDISEAMAAHYISLSGGLGYCSLRTTVEGFVAALPDAQLVDIRVGEPVLVAAPERNPEQRTVWSNIYKDDAALGLTMTAATPFVDRNGEFAGITGIDVSLDDLLASLRPQSGRSYTIDDDLISFLMDEQGRLIAFPVQRLPEFGFAVDLAAMTDSTHVIDYRLGDSTNAAVQEMAATIFQERQQVFDLDLDGIRYEVASEQMAATGWYLVKLMPEAVLLRSVVEIKDVLAISLDSMSRSFAWSAVLVYAATLLVMAVVLRCLIRPLLALTRASGSAAQVCFDQRVEIQRSDELGELATSFNGMLDSLSQAALREREYSATLEREVAEQTRELRQYERMVATSQDMIAVVDPDGVYELVNEAHLARHGLSREEIIGRRISDLLDEEQFVRKVRPCLERALAGESLKIQDWFEYSLGEGQWERRFMSVHYSPHTTDDGKIRRVVISLRDLTGIKRVEEELRKTQQQMIHSEKMAALGRMVAGLAHEINNTINFSSGALPPLRRRIQALIHDEVQDRASLAADLEILLNNIDEGNQRTQAIVRRLTMFSRREINEPVSVDLHGELDRALLLVETEGYGVELVKDYGVGLPEIICVPDQLCQVFVNLLLNAHQAMGGSGQIAVQTRADANWFRVQICDQGPGIDEQILDKIFEPFYTTKDPGQGTGLGLSISYDIIQRHQGQIRAWNHEAGGACFELKLPLQHNSSDSSGWEEGR